ncbi:MAG: 50S ribosomal protein L6 [Candidatus Omnitrophica bacterium]|nr:50S ribosomal protein L6 [Candidatus Omnitrophota bacterium]
MSRVGNRPITIIKGVEIKSENSLVSVKGPKGELSLKIDPDFTVSVTDKVVEIKRPSDSRSHKEKHGLFRALVQNMVTGVTEGYTKELIIVGVGFKAIVKGKFLDLNLGFSHTINFPIPQGITIAAPSQTQVVISGCDKSKVGEVAAKIRSYYPAEPYKGKGVRYLGEKVRRKAGKTVK